MTLQAFLDIDWEAEHLANGLVVLGLDMSIASTGWAVMEDGWVTEAGTIQTTGQGKNGLSTIERIIKIRDEVGDLYRNVNPDCVIREQMFSFGGHSRSTDHVLAALNIMAEAVVFEIARDNGFRMEMIAVESSKWRSFAGNKANGRAEVKAESVRLANEYLGYGGDNDDEAEACWIAAYGTYAWELAMRDHI